jgi:hypothetical protein
MATIDRQAAKAAGYTDAQIDQFERENGLTSSAPTTQTTPVTTQPQQQPTSTSLTPSQVLTGAVMNFPSSLYSMATDVFKAVTDPIQTARDLGTLFVGATSKVLGEPFFESDLAKQMRLKGEKSAEQVGAFMVNRYGSVESAKQALATDPAGVLSDASLVFTGGATLAPKTSTVSKVLSTTAKVTDPLSVITAPVKLGAQALAPSLGMITGAGSEAVRQAYQAGKEGGEKAKSFIENLRGTADQLQVLEDAKTNLDAMIKQQQKAYRKNMANIRTDQTVLKFDDVDTALKNAMDKVTYKGKVKSQYALDKVEEAQKIIDDWKNSDPATYHTPEGLDALKQSVGDVLESIPFEKKSSRLVVGDIYNSIKSTIQKQAPTYADTMRQYADAAEQIKEIERSLSLGKKATADAGLRKLQSIMRNNVNANYGQRMNLATQLEQAGNIPIKPALAGQALSSWTPRGIQGAGTIGTAGLLGSQISTPLGVGYLAASSPRLVGESAFMAGKGAKQVGKVTGLFPELDYPLMFNVLSNAQTE